MQCHAELMLVPLLNKCILLALLSLFLPATRNKDYQADGCCVSMQHDVTVFNPAAEKSYKYTIIGN